MIHHVGRETVSSTTETRREITARAKTNRHDPSRWRDARMPSGRRAADSTCSRCGQTATVYGDGEILTDPFSVPCDRGAIRTVRAALRRSEIYTLTTYGRSGGAGIPARVRVFTIERGRLREITRDCAAVLQDVMPDPGEGIAANGYGYSRPLHVVDGAARAVGITLDQSRMREI